MSNGSDKRDFTYEELRGAASSMQEHLKRNNFDVVAQKAAKVELLARKLHFRKQLDKKS